MIYIKFTKDYNEAFDKDSKLPKFLKKIVFQFSCITGKFFIRKIFNGELIILPSTTELCKKRLLKFLRVYSIKTICISKELEERKFLEGIDLNVLNGKWLYKYLILNYIKYIANEQEKNLRELEISFLINKITEIDLKNIEETAKLVKVVNIVTDSVSRIKILSDKLYKENGIVLNITKNYKKSLAKSSIIVNMDFLEDEINKYVIPRKVSIINIGKETKIKYKGFEGVNILDYSTSFPSKYLNTELSTDSFRKEILYESFIYKNTSPKNIFKEIKNDNINIESLIGQKGIIRKTEFSK